MIPLSAVMASPEELWELYFAKGAKSCCEVCSSPHRDGLTVRPHSREPWDRLRYNLCLTTFNEGKSST